MTIDCSCRAHVVVVFQAGERFTQGAVCPHPFFLFSLNSSSSPATSSSSIQFILRPIQLLLVLLLVPDLPQPLLLLRSKAALSSGKPRLTAFATGGASRAGGGADGLGCLRGGLAGGAAALGGRWRGWFRRGASRWFAGGSVHGSEGKKGVAVVELLGWSGVEGLEAGNDQPWPYHEMISSTSIALALSRAEARLDGNPTVNEDVGVAVPAVILYAVRVP
ncbi:hypothetical protein BDK51DRAFT_38851 [Blyttiomyces helicus]|uniref:Uncharacterized protein n=1 Tax=Blyttiomyces helicus TaxID=388810 RepID=A0A4P9WDC4_9FUNG|nr:hypothetical protein BDK51DRAFT_38851 [Blyttiomyces helicus]|eukprot:RKO90534.1 hypothetical protein BDK51DRAFT_38851 [Blyttiomyces helicus]